MFISLLLGLCGHWIISSITRDAGNGYRRICILVNVKLYRIVFLLLINTPTIQCNYRWAEKSTETRFC